MLTKILAYKHSKDIYINNKRYLHAIHRKASLASRITNHNYPKRKTEDALPATASTRRKKVGFARRNAPLRETEHAALPRKKE